MSNKSVFLMLTAVCSILWYSLCAYAVSEMFSLSIIAFALAIYACGFCEVGLEKFFFTRYLSGKTGYPKSLSFLGMCLIPTAISSFVFLLTSVSGKKNNVLFALVIVCAGISLYRIIFTTIENRFIKR